jgi:acetyl esterase/lipase
VDPDEVLTRTSDLPDAVLRYADHADGVVDVHLPPTGDGSPRPLVFLLHGGFWRSEWDRVHTRPVAVALANEGFVVATPEFRRVGAGGGWPATFDDVAAAFDALPRLLRGLGVAITTTTVVGHSAGGHLALWLAGRDGAGAPEPSAPRTIDRAVGLAAVGHLRHAAGLHLGDGAPQDLLGGEPEEVSERYDAADPATLLAPQVEAEVVVVHGGRDDVVPVSNAHALVRACPQVRLVELSGVEHFALIDPLSDAWPHVLEAVRGDAPGRGERLEP